MASIRYPIAPAGVSALVMTFLQLERVAEQTLDENSLKMVELYR